MASTTTPPTPFVETSTSPLHIKNDDDPVASQAWNGTLSADLVFNGKLKDVDAQSVKTLFCMLLQMQSSVKGIQANVSDLENRVTQLEKETNSDHQTVSLQNQKASRLNIAIDDDISSTPLTTTSTTSGEEARPVAESRTETSGSPSADEPLEEKVGPTDPRTETERIFIPEETTPRRVSTPPTTTPEQIPFISRRTLWKKANKPKWKRRSDLVPRLKEILSEKCKAEKASQFCDDGDVTSERCDFSLQDKSQDNDGIETQTPNSANLNTLKLLTTSSVFPGLPTPSCLAPIWRAPEVMASSIFAKPEMTTTTTMEPKSGIESKSEAEAVHGECNAKPEFMCNVCFKVLASKSSLDTHTKSIHENRKFPCNDCGKRFFDRSTLRRHKKCIHENVTHRCKFCSLEFSRRHYLTSHVHKEHPGSAPETDRGGTKGTTTSTAASRGGGAFSVVALSPASLLRAAGPSRAAETSVSGGEG